MKNPSGYGSIDRMKGNRRKPYRVRITTDYTIDETGRARQVQRTLGTYATYQEAADALSAYNRNPVALDDEITFAEVFRQYMEKAARKLAPKTVKAYRAAYGDLSPLHDRTFRKLRRADLQRVIDDSGLGFAMLQTVLAVLRNMYKYALKTDLTDADYSRNVDIAQYRPTKEEQKAARKIHKSLTEDELSVLWANSADPFVREVLMLCYSGLRIAEYLALTPEDIDTDARIIAIDAAKTPSGTRRVPIAQKTAAMWAELREARKIPDTRTAETQYKEFADRLSAKMAELELPDHLPHDTRYTCATLMHRAKVDLLTRKRILGHVVKDITEGVYTDTADAELLAAIDSI